MLTYMFNFLLLPPSLIVSNENLMYLNDLGKHRNTLVTCGDCLAKVPLPESQFKAPRVPT